MNAARHVRGQVGIVLERQQSYIGTLIDDLVTKGVLDPYRMMTSRSEYRLYLRQDNADERLTPLGREIGLVDDKRWERFTEMRAAKEAEMKRIAAAHFSPQKANGLLVAKGLLPVKSGVSAEELLKRPELGYSDIATLLGWGAGVDSAIAARVEVEIKYEGYIRRQMEQIESVRREGERRIPGDMVYQGLTGLRLEAREKLERVRPETVGQASRIPGVSPSDIAQLVLILAAKA